ncbi:MAG TPA: hypothetical protein VMI06_04160 [Terriglobia bacterium]|nr:hypothetical protein [Terriglobia bacterium]
MIPIGVLLAGCLALAGPQTGGQTVAQPSLGELARQARAERAKENLRNVPLITNDNLSSFLGGLGVIGSGDRASQQLARENAAQQESVEKQKFETLRYELSQAQQRLQLHQRELSVLEKELSQNRMQYYPNPYQSAVEQFSRKDINNLTEQIYEKQRQITDDQQTVDSLQAAVQSAQSRWDGLGGSEGPPSPPPITAKLGSPSYWLAKLARARERLKTAKEQERLAGNELRLLRIEQVRTLNPDAQAGLASAVSAKEDELTAAQNAVEAAQLKLQNVQEKMKASGVTPEKD